MTGEDLIVQLWQNCRNAARYTGSANAEAVQRLIFKTREILSLCGCSKDDADSVLYTVYIMAHWDWTEPTARIFEALLGLELADYFKERMDICNP